VERRKEVVIRKAILAGEEYFFMAKCLGVVNLLKLPQEKEIVYRENT